MVHRVRALLPLLLIAFIGCAPRLMVKKGVNVSTLGICVDYDNSTATQEMVPTFDSTLAVFIDRYNSEHHGIRLERCSDRSRSSLIIEMVSTNLIGPGGQAGGVCLTGIGLSLPFILLAAHSPVWVAFAYLPQNFTKTYVSLSDNIDEGGRILRNFASSPYFGSIDRQKVVHAQRFSGFLRELMNEIEDSNRSGGGGRNSGSSAHDPNPY
jgi:hypothetical protein